MSGESKLLKTIVSRVKPLHIHPDSRSRQKRSGCECNPIGMGDGNCRSETAAACYERTSVFVRYNFDVGRQYFRLVKSHGELSNRILGTAAAQQPFDAPAFVAAQLPPLLPLIGTQKGMGKSSQPYSSEGGQGGKCGQSG